MRGAHLVALDPGQIVTAESVVVTTAVDLLADALGYILPEKVLGDVLGRAVQRVSEEPGMVLRAEGRMSSLPAAPVYPRRAFLQPV